MIVANLLSFNGRAKEAMLFYVDVLDGKFLFEMNYDERTTDETELLGKVFHGELQIGEHYLYFEDVKEPVEYKGFEICVEYHETLEEAKNVFDKLKEGGTVICPIEKRPYGPSIGSLVDQFGVTWNIIYAKPEENLNEG